MSGYRDRASAPRYGGNRGGGNKDFDNTNRGSLWENDKATSDRSPNWKGSINVDGVEYWLAMWEGKGRGERTPAFTLSVTPKDDARTDSRRDDRRRDHDLDRDRRGGGNDYARAKAGRDDDRPRDDRDGRRDYGGHRDEPEPEFDEDGRPYR
jgi:hypothetical protein